MHAKQRIQLDPPMRFLIVALVVAVAMLFEVARAHGADEIGVVPAGSEAANPQSAIRTPQFVSELYPPSTQPAKPVRRSTIDTAIPRAADAEVTPTPTPAPEPADPFVQPTIVKPKLLFLTCRNAPSFMFSQLAARETAAIEKLREKYDIIQVNVPALPSIVDVDANRLYTPDQCSLYYGCAPIAGLVTAIEQNQAGGVTVSKAVKRVTRAQNPIVPQEVSSAVESAMTAPNGPNPSAPPVNTPTLGESSALKPVPDPAFAN